MGCLPVVFRPVFAAFCASARFPVGCDAMQPRPTEPTSALAALIAGNHRYLERRAGETSPRTEERSVAHLFPQKPFALVVAQAGTLTVTPHIFALGHDDVVVVDSIDDAATLVTLHGVSLIVMLESVHGSGGSTLAERVTQEPNGTWRYAERRAWASIELILQKSRPIRLAIAARELRAVAALFEVPAGRVHWIGEHPDTDALLRDE